LPFENFAGVTSITRPALIATTVGVVSDRAGKNRERPQHDTDDNNTFHVSSSVKQVKLFSSR
jgi:hypothetical protein